MGSCEERSGGQGTKGTKGTKGTEEKPRTVVNLRNLEKLVSSVLLKFLNLTNFFTLPLPQKQPQPLPLAGIKNNTRDFWGVGVWWVR